MTQKSWQILTSIKKEFEFILIGGWAVYLYTQAQKSKDIDIVIDFSVLDKLRTKYDLVKNERLKKYQIKKEGIDIDIYLPHYSNLGPPVEEIFKYQTALESFHVPVPEVLLITKQNAYKYRLGSIKGEKDKLDIISLLLLNEFDFTFYKKLLRDYKLDFLKLTKVILTATSEVEELYLNKHFFARKKKELLKKL